MIYDIMQIYRNASFAAWLDFVRCVPILNVVLGFYLCGIFVAIFQRNVEYLKRQASVG